jgi:muramoyltetrapeptide carboxypeptidase
MSLAGTPYWPNLSQAILYIECAEDQSFQDFKHHLTQLKYMNVLKNISGLLVGRLPSSLKISLQSLEKTIFSVLDPNSRIPVLTHFDCGHTDPVFTLPIGYSIQIETDPCSITIHLPKP